MYINFINDRKALGYKQFKSTLKNPVTWIIRKAKHIVIFLFSKEVLVAVFIFLQPAYIEPNVDPPSFTASEVYQSCVIKSDNLRFLKGSDFIVKLQGGSDGSEEKQKKLVKSLISKSSQSDYSEISINKFLKKILNLIDPVISDQRFWRILSEFDKPKLSPTVVEAFRFDNATQLSFMQKRVQFMMDQMAQKQDRVPLKMAPNHFSDNLESSGLSRNHEQLSQDLQWIEKKTQQRRAQPLYPSEVLGDSFKYGGKQLERKGRQHLEDFGISVTGKTDQELAMEYKDVVEMGLSHSSIRKDGTLNEREPTTHFVDPKSRQIVVFENNPLYQDQHFVTSYPISDMALTKFLETGNIGESPEIKEQKLKEVERNKLQAEREKTTAHLFYMNLPSDARIGNRQLSEVETLQEQLKEDPSISLTEKQKAMLQRAEKYQQYKNKFYQDIDRDEF